jgi:hypothetical protein
MRKGDIRVGNLEEIKKHLDRLTQLGKSMPERALGMKGPEGEERKKKAKEEGTRLGIGVGISFFGLIMAAVALVYSLAAIILLVNIALDKLWLSALIVVGGFLIIGGVLVAVGAGMARASVKKLSSTTKDLKTQIKQTAEEMKTEVEGLKKQMAELAGSAKKSAPVAGPVAIGSYLAYRLLKRAMKSRREKRRILRVIESYEEARTQG